MIKLRHLKRSSKETLERFARWLKLTITPDMSKNHIARLIRWRISPLRNDNFEYDNRSYGSVNHIKIIDKRAR